ncbi:hypothetical protein ZHAS_00003263 [Anopheles sinensis]|uniref:Uncharacterized protein n=1 Tax=Anopheles sinensis TaxID=74873 RepID=A0A084VDY6_ANOSI|nr:hypothetical protein ZHAS_00003263 [Anopheles sinensis]
MTRHNEEDGGKSHPTKWGGHHRRQATGRGGSEPSGEWEGKKHPSLHDTSTLANLNKPL